MSKSQIVRPVLALLAVIALGACGNAARPADSTNDAPAATSAGTSWDGVQETPPFAEASPTSSVAFVEYPPLVKG